MGKTVGLVLALKDKCSPQLKAIADRMGITEKEAKKLHSQAKNLSKDLGNGFKKASAVCAGAVGAVALATQQLVSQTMQAGDRVDKMSQKIGMSRKAFQEWDYVMSQNGGSVESLQMGYKKLAGQMDGVQKGSKNSVQLFNQLGVSVKDSSGQLRSQEDVFNDTVRALQKIENPTQKAIMANKLFGKSAQELMPLLNQTADSTDKLRQKANDMGMIMSDQAIDASVKLTDTMDTIQRSLLGLGLSIGAELLPIIQQFADKFIESMPQIKSAVTPVLMSLVHILKFTADHMEALIAIGTAVVSTVISFNVINTTIKIIATLQKVIKLVTMAQGVWNAVMLANPIGAIAVGIGVLIGAIVLLVRNWDKVTEAVQKAINALKTFIGIKPDKKTVEVEQKTTKTENKPKKHALGTSFSSGGTAWVGENGPELLNLNRGDSITPADKSQQIAQGNTTVNISLNVQGNVLGNREFFNEMMSLMALELRKAIPA